MNCFIAVEKSWTTINRKTDKFWFQTDGLVAIGALRVLALHLLKSINP